MGEVVNVSRRDGIAVVTVDRPPVNAIDRTVRAELQRAFTELGLRPDVRAVVLGCAGRTFFAGADIREFDTGIAPPTYHEVFRLIEDSPVPVVAAIHGTALGAGTEIALACHYRVAAEDARLGLPELSLGIIPGAGGTQRLPRLIPLAAAADMMLSGRPLPAGQAKDLGLLDQVISGDVIAGAIAFAKMLVAEGRGPRKTRDLPVRDAASAASLLAEKRALIAKTMRGRNSPARLLDALQAAAEKPFAEGLAIERTISAELEQSLESRALRHLFFAEREARKIPGLPEQVRPRPVRRVGIVGAGTMGGGIAMAFANAGIPVTILDANQPALDAGLAKIRTNYQRSVSRGSLKPDQLEARLQLIAPTLDFSALGDVDLVIEAVFEKMPLKKETFARLDQVAKPGAILATNTSTLNIDEIAAATRRPQDVLGLHFFSPANVMPLLEIVRARHTADDVLITALEIARTIRKVGVVAKVCYGFIGNRMMDPYGREAERCLLEGATPEQVDTALESFGMAMGILAVFDLAGVDIGHLTRLALGDAFAKDPTYYRPSAMLTERGWLGQKTGRGYYRYENGRRIPDPEVVELFHQEGRRLGVPQRKPSAEEIRDRCLFALINEGARVLEEGIALRASDIDVVYTSGYGFPRHRGGPMFYADTVGLKNIYDRIIEFQRTLDARYWQPAPLVQRLAQRNSTFRQWQDERSAAPAAAS
ncbi:MAG TPA: 3-hydroxyacyl-CoA dehydrogenase NAD-binding domain-containing protein [Xanthobacteraceae bacterium]|nr:3-hydroxyacyl-CoA dehydrogenase NAD-binding domain-containing protein [Xanthobacteraceae bacterium]